MPLKPIKTKDRVEQIKKDAGSAFQFATSTLKRRWPEAEPYIMKDPYFAYHYCSEFFNNKRWPEAEPYIMKEPLHAFMYANNIIEKRWPEAEPYIMKEPSSAYYYAKNILKKKWPEAEPYIREDPYWKKQYINEFGK